MGEEETSGGSGQKGGAVMVWQESVYSIWLSAREEERLRREGGDALPDVLACIQQGAAWRARRNSKRLCEGPPERRLPRTGATEILYLWPLTMRRVWADLEQERAERSAPADHAFHSSARTSFCSVWLTEHSGSGGGYHCGRMRSEHRSGALR